MSYDMGDVVPLSISITDPSGIPANATAVSVAIRLPDGTTVNSATLTPLSTGQYEYDYTPIQVGRHGVYWTATGANASAYIDAFDVTPTDNGNFISLADTKNHMKRDLTAHTDDEKMRGFISSACQMITDRVGPVSPATYVEVVWSRAHLLILSNYPVISVTSVVSLPGGASLVAGDETAGVQGWILDSPLSGVMRHTHRFPGQMRITYRAGRAVLPPNFRLAGLELTAHLWRVSQMNSGGNRPPIAQDEQIVPGTTFALPYSVRQLLGLDKRPQRGILL